MATQRAAPEQFDKAALKKAHSVFYEENTSDIKDELPALCTCLKTGTGALNRQEAGFLLWHHALDGPDTQSELISCGLVGACLALIDPHGPGVSAPEKTCAAGILVALCEAEDSREAVVKGKVGSTNAVAILHGLIHDARDTMRLYAARVLRLAADAPAARTAMLKLMDQQLQHVGLYCELLLNCHDSPTINQLCHFITALLHGREDLKAQAVTAGMVEACLSALKHHKVDSACCAVLGLLCSLTEVTASLARVFDAGGVPVLVDLLGPPPQSVVDAERRAWPHVVDPAGWVAMETKRLTVARELELQQRASVPTSAASTNQALPPAEGSSRDVSPSGKMFTRAVTSSRKVLSPDDQATRQAARAMEAGGPAAARSKDAQLSTGSPPDALPPIKVVLPPNPPPGTLLSISTVPLKWNAFVSQTTYSHAAGCLYNLCQEPQYMQAASERLAATRLVPLMLRVMEDGSAAGGKKGKAGKKKKGLSLNPEQTEGLVHITGALKFLSLLNLNRYRMAKLGALAPLVALYQECSHTLLRRNAQVCLGNMALLAENGQLLLDGCLPEELLVSRPMRLTPQEVDQLRTEFPGAIISSKT